MSSKVVGIEDARKRLGDLITAVQQGTDIIVTRNGKPAARLIAYKEPAMDINTTVITCYKSNSDSVYIQANDGPVWDLGSNVSDFVTDASGWVDGEWEPGEHNGQTRTTTDGLTPVATWNANDSLRLLVERDHLGGTADNYVSEHRHQ